MLELPKRGECAYTPFFCEENIWRLGNRLRQGGFPSVQGTVLFFSNASRQAPLRKQRLGSPNDDTQAVLWDYHVVLHWQDEGHGSVILDFDSCLPWPCATATYCAETFLPWPQTPLPFRIQTRLVPLTEYLTNFRSNRTHMLDQAGIPRCAFPPYPPLLPQHSRAVDLSRYINMSDPSCGPICWWPEFPSRLTSA